MAETKRKLAKFQGTSLDDVIDDFEEAISLDPFNAELRSALVTVYEREGLDDLAGSHRLAIWCWSMCE